MQLPRVCQEGFNLEQESARIYENSTKVEQGTVMHHWHGQEEHRERSPRNGEKL